MDKPEIQGNITRLYKFLGLPRARRWGYFEWFYSNIDRPLLLGENDFSTCLRLKFASLKSRELTRSQWSLIRRLIGKPRRCSPAFFSAERRSLLSKRDKVRKLQQQYPLTTTSLRDLGDNFMVPVVLAVGSKVTARLRNPVDGLYPGTVVGIDALNCAYEIAFDDPSAGTQMVPDFEVASDDPPFTLPVSAVYNSDGHLNLSAASGSPTRNSDTPSNCHSSGPTIQHRSAHRKNSSGFGSGMGEHVGLCGPDCTVCGSNNSPFQSTSDPVLSGPSGAAPLSGGSLGGMGDVGDGAVNAANGGGSLSSPPKRSLMLNEADTCGDYPMSFLHGVAKMSRMLEAKRRCIDEISAMNSEAQSKASSNECVSVDFQKTYEEVFRRMSNIDEEYRNCLFSVAPYAREVLNMPVQYFMDEGSIPSSGSYFFGAHHNESANLGQNLRNSSEACDSASALVPPTPMEVSGAHGSHMSQHSGAAGGSMYSQASWITSAMNGGLHPAYLANSGMQNSFDNNSGDMSQMGHLTLPGSNYSAAEVYAAHAAAAYNCYGGGYMMNADNSGSLVEEIRMNCDNKAEELVMVRNNQHQVQRAESMSLIRSLISILMQINTLGQMLGRVPTSEFNVIQRSMREVKENLHKENIGTFEVEVEMRINHILSTMECPPPLSGPSGQLHFPSAASGHGHGPPQSVATAHGGYY